MNLVTEPYLTQVARWPKSGRHILAQLDHDSVVVYQAYRPDIGHFAAQHGYFGGPFSLNRMSWIKPNFLWMMYRCGWASKEGQEVVLAIRLKQPAFDEILRRAVHSSFIPGDGEFFEVVRQPETAPEIAVLDVQPSDRHLLLLVREGGEKHKFLCGHDERHWFVAAIPESAPVGTVRQAKEALKPAEVQVAQDLRKLRAEARNRRKNVAYQRQGEWFFLPVSSFQVDESLVLKDEPLRRGNGGKPHWVEFCFRTGGETVYVCPRHSNGVSAREYQRILSGNPRARAWGWQPMRRNAGVYVRGRVRHADHKTIVLHGWHRVLMNTEGESRAMRNVAFLD